MGEHVRLFSEYRIEIDEVRDLGDVTFGRVVLRGYGMGKWRAGRGSSVARCRMERWRDRALAKLSKRGRSPTSREAVGAAGCGGGTNTQPQLGVGPDVGQPINLADCHDWNQANAEQRLGTIEQLKDFAGGPVVGNNVGSGGQGIRHKRPTGQ